MPPTSKRKQKGLLLFAALCVVFLFLGGPDIIHSRSFKHSWDLGHIAAFAEWTLLLMRSWPWLAAAPFGQQATVVLLCCFAVGGSVEIVQGLFGRYPAWDDDDRFNRSYVMQAGWNRIRVPLKDVENAPYGRKMDLKQITEFNLFAVRLPVPRTLYLDDLTLETGPMDTSR